MSEQNKNFNTGFLVEKPTKDDYIAGNESGIVYYAVIPTGNWSFFLPTEESQKTNTLESMSCVTFSALNSIETQVDYKIENKLIPEATLEKIKALGFIDNNGKFNCSDRFTAYMSGTTKNGNSLRKVLESIRKHGLLPQKDWDFTGLEGENFDWDLFFTDPGQERKDKAKKILDILDIKWEWVLDGSVDDPLEALSLIKKHIKQAPLQIAAPVCSPWNVNRIVERCGLTKASHATLLYFVDESCFFDFDHYVPFKKRLSLDYFIPFATKILVEVKESTPTTDIPIVFKYSFKKTIRYGEKSEEVLMLQTALKKEGCFPQKVVCTRTYGNITEQAVRVFMDKYKIGSFIERKVFGGRFVGYKMRRKLNEIFNK